jgi:hypothetical protein
LSANEAGEKVSPARRKKVLVKEVKMNRAAFQLYKPNEMGTENRMKFSGVRICPVAK